jgi:hypothetical protein
LSWTHAASDRIHITTEERKAGRNRGRIMHVLQQWWSSTQTSSPTTERTRTMDRSALDSAQDALDRNYCG